MEELPLAAANLKLENEEAGLSGSLKSLSSWQRSLVSFTEIISNADSPPSIVAWAKTASELGIEFEIGANEYVTMDQTVTFAFPDLK